MTPLEALARYLEDKDLRLVRFHEPDLGGMLTAICVEPAGNRFLGNLPLAGRTELAAA